MTNRMSTSRGATKIAKLVNITTITMVYGSYITIVRWGYKPTYNIWGPLIVVANPLTNEEFDVEHHHHEQINELNGP